MEEGPAVSHALVLVVENLSLICHGARLAPVALYGIIACAQRAITTCSVSDGQNCGPTDSGDGYSDLP